MLLATMALNLNRPPQTALRLPDIFSDHMVLQRNQSIPFWGMATPGSKVTVRMDGRFAVAKVRQDGTWNVKLRPHEAGGPYTVEVEGDGTITYNDVLIGEVWVAAGQSNMELPICQQSDVETAQSEANSNIRMFTVGRKSSETPLADSTGSWAVANPDSVMFFSAVAFWFGNDLRKWLNVPIGIIHSSWGGTPAEAWMRRDALLEESSLAYLVHQYLDGLPDYPTRKQNYDRELLEWQSKAFSVDTENVGFQKDWALPSFDIRDWHWVRLPNLIESTEADNFDGAVWYRRNFEVPPEWAGRQLVVELGTIDDYDTTYINNHRVGGIDSTHEFAASMTRQYMIAPGLVRPGTNTIAVRVFDKGSNGGFTGAASMMRIFPYDGAGTPVPLAGSWQSKVERRIAPPAPELVAAQPVAPYGPGHPWVPGGLWNAMVQPVVPYGIKGVIWYQGESNVSRADEYRELFPALIRDWRSAWRQGAFPFYFVQLANFSTRANEPGDSTWAELREAQAFALREPKTGMAVALDLGEANDIHPKNKLEVGRRLSLQALANTYGIDVSPRGPHFRSMRVEGSSIRVTMDDAKGLRTWDSRPPAGFAIAGADQRFYWARAELDGDSIILRSDRVNNPVAVRYAWANNPDVNLFNVEGLPAEPFRTDDWPLSTLGKKRS